VLEIHEQQIEIYGGSHGLRDAGALEPAVAAGKLGKDELTGYFVRHSQPAPPL
jgi:hypothetical protein